MVTMRFEGGEAMVKRLESLPAAVSRRVQLKALILAAGPMRDRMESGVLPRGAGVDPANRIVISPLRTGELLDAQEVGIAVGPTSQLFYGFEFGTVRQEPRPFARPAFDTSAPAALGVLGRELWAALRQALPTTFAAADVGTVGGRFR